MSYDKTYCESSWVINRFFTAVPKDAVNLRLYRAETSKIYILRHVAYSQAKSEPLLPKKLLTFIGQMWGRGQGIRMGTNSVLEVVDSIDHMLESKFIKIIFV